MSKTIPQIMKYMSVSPHTIGGDQPVVIAEELMKQHRIRHLPVLEDGKMIGIVSDRDIKLFVSLSGVDPTRDTVRDIADREVYTVSPEALLDEVAMTMAEKKYGSAVVVDHHKVVGIFTTVDAMRALSELLHTRLK